VRCCYGEKNGLPKRMFDYALHNGLEFCGPAYTVYLLDAASVSDAEQFLLQVAVQVQRNADYCALPGC
jgi:effector-binding domain-containing protein